MSVNHSIGGCVSGHLGHFSLCGAVTMLYQPGVRQSLMCHPFCAGMAKKCCRMCMLAMLGGPWRRGTEHTKLYLLDAAHTRLHCCPVMPVQAESSQAPQQRCCQCPKQALHRRCFPLRTTLCPSCCCRCSLSLLLLLPCVPRQRPAHSHQSSSCCTARQATPQGHPGTYIHTHALHRPGQVGVGASQLQQHIWGHSHQLHDPLPVPGPVWVEQRCSTEHPEQGTHQTWARQQRTLGQQQGTRSTATCHGSSSSSMQQTAGE
jgi:hypothetical protein